MTIDIASLIFEIDSTQAVTARERLDDLEKAGARVDAAARKVKTATELAGIGIDKTASATGRATRAATEYAQSQGAAERAAMQAERAATRAAEREAAAWARVEAQLERRNAAYRGDLAAQQMRDAERASLAQQKAADAAAEAVKRAAAEQEQATASAARAAERAAAQEAAAWAKLEAQLERRNAAYRGDFAAQQMRDAEKAAAAQERAANAAAAAAERAANKEAAAWAKVEAQLAKRNAAYQGAQALAAMREEAAAAANLERRIDALMNSIDPTRAAQARLNAEMAEASALYKAGAISASDYAKAVGVLDVKMAEAARQQGVVNGLHGSTARGAKLAAHEMANLGSQFADIGVSLASGQALWLVAIQQGAQIGGVYGNAAARGVTFASALEGIAAAAAPAIAVLTPLALLTGTVAAGFGLLHRELAKGYPDDITDGLGLTAEQLDRVKDRTVTMGDTWAATIDVMGKYLTQGPLGDAFDWLNKRWNAWLDEMTVNTVNEVANIVGFFVGAYRSIVNQWRNLPAVFADLSASAINFVIDGVEKLVNANIAGINAIISAATSWTGAAAPQMDLVDFSRFKAEGSGAAEFVGKAIVAEIGGAIEEVRGGMSRLATEIGAGARQNAVDRVREQAGKPNKGPAGRAAPRDASDSRSAQLDGLVAQAKAEELQAQLSITREIEDRAKIEREILDQQEALKSAQLARVRAGLDADLEAKRLSRAAHDELVAQLDIAAAANERAKAYRQRAINDAKAEALADEQLAIRSGERDAQARLLDSQRDLERSAAGRRAIDLQLLKLSQRQQRDELERAAASTTATQAQKEIALSLLAQLDAIHGNQTSAAYRLEDAYDDAANAASDVANAFERQDWYGLTNGLVDAFKALTLAFSKTEDGLSRMNAAAGVAGIANIAGQAIGGKTGNAISGAASGAMGGLALAQLGLIGGPFGLIAGGLIGGVASILGGNKEKQRQKAQQEAADIANAQAIAQERANQQAEMELRILELSGDEVAATAKRREAELSALTGANRALQEHIYALEDWAKAVQTAQDAVSKAEDDLRDAYNVERDRLQAIIGGVDAARDALRDAYQRERSAIEGAASSLRSLIDTLSDFRAELDLASESPGLQYEAARRQFATAAPEDIAATGRTFVDISRSTSATDLDFQRDLAAVRRKTDEASATAKTQLSNSERQLAALESLVSPLLAVNDNLLTVDQAISRLATAEQDAAMAAAEMARLDAQVGALITINSSVLTVAQAIGNLQGAIGALAAAQASKPTGGAGGASYEAVGYSGYVDRNADLAALYASGGGMAAGRTKEEFGAYHWERYGQGEDRYYRPFARGGAFTNGIVNDPTTFDMGVMGEAGPEAIMPLVMGPKGLGVRANGGDTGRLEALVENLTKKVEELTKRQTEDNREIKRNTKETADIMAKVTQGDTAVRVKAA